MRGEKEIVIEKVTLGNTRNFGLRFKVIDG